MVMMHSTSASHDDLPRNHHHQIMSEDQDQEQDQEIINPTCPISWKLYQNPFFVPTNTTTNHSINPHKLKHKQLQRKYSASAKFLHLDLKMNNLSINSGSYNNSNTSLAIQTQIAELKAELEMERKLRKKMEALNKKLSRELVDQVQKERTTTCVCEDLTKEITRLKEEMDKMRVEMEEERKMLRMAEVLREERVQMKLADAHLFYHQEFLNQFLLKQQQQQQKDAAFVTCFAAETKRLGSSADQQRCLTGNKNGNVQRKTGASPEAENPHIKQGIKGFVEFQRAIKAKNGSNSTNTSSSSSSNSGGSTKQLRDVGSYSNKVECQKAQLRVLFKHKGSLPYSQHDHLIIS